MRRRKDTYVRANSMADIQELADIIQNQKEVFDYRERSLKNKINELNKVILIMREEFLSFLKKNNIDPNYPVLNDVMGDDVVPDTVPEQSMESIPIEQAMLPNIPNVTFLNAINTMKEKFPSLQDAIEEYTDTLMKMRLHKSSLERSLEVILKATEEYRGRIAENKEDYDDAVKNLEKIKDLYQNLLDFKILFTTVPDSFTSDAFIKFQINHLGKYCSDYCGKKVKVKKISDKLQETYKLTRFDQVEEGVYTTVFRNVSLYFSPNEGENNLPDQYVDAVTKKEDILKKLEGFSSDLDKLIVNTKATLDAIRGVKGIGNAHVQGLITSSNEIAQSFAAAKRVEHTTMETEISVNKIIKAGNNKKIESIRGKLQNGVGKLDEVFIRIQRGILRRIYFSLGHPMEYVHNRTTSLEDHVRGRVRTKYGGDIPFCDEDVIINSSGVKTFIKKSDVDEKTGKPKVEVQGNELEEKTRINENIASA